MKKVIYLALAFLTVAISYNCKKSLPAPDPGNVKLYLPEEPYNYAAVREGNSTKFLYFEDGQPVNDDKATLGRVLFYDKALSLNSTIACASCHIQANGFADRTSFSKGFEEKLTLRNSMSICNLTEERNIGYFWDGRRNSIRELVMDPVANHIEMGFDRIDLIATKINKLPYYADLFKKAYGTTTASEDKIRESMGHFLFSIVTPNSDIDVLGRNDFNNMSKSEKEGMKLFKDAHCDRCHLVSGSIPSQYYGIRFANIGLDEKDKDQGVSGMFKIPRLMNIAHTAPYMHDGRFKTLEEVVEHYSNGIKDNPNLNFILKNYDNTPMRFSFTAQQKSDLVAFLKTIQDKDMLTDKKYSSPFIP